MFDNFTKLDLEIRFDFLVRSLDGRFGFVPPRFSEIGDDVESIKTYLHLLVHCLNLSDSL